MKSYKNISNRHIFLKKKHFYLTLLGIVMSVALVTAMMTLMYSLVENLRLNDIQNNGSHHIKISAITREEADVISQRTEIETYGIVYGTDRLSAGNYSKEVSEYWGIKYKMLEVARCDNDCFSILPYRLERGSYPAASDEIIVDNWFLENYESSAQIGSTISLPVMKLGQSGYTTEGSQKYKITGILYSSDNISTINHGRAATLQETSADADSYVTMYIRVTKGYNITKFIDSVSASVGPAEIEKNNSLIGLEGRDGDIGVLGPVFSIGLFLAAIIVIATVAVIYNSFSISVLEKTSLYGLLRTSGATPRQIRRLVYREASYYAVLGIPIGTLIGLGVTYILLEFVGFEPFNMTGSGLSTFISPWFVMIGIAIGILTVYISAYLPALRAGKVSPVEAISGKKTISIGKPARVNRRTLLGKTAGLPGAMAAKNLKRNKKRFRVTIFSIIVSSILFIVFNSLVIFSMDNNPYVSVGFDYILSAGSPEHRFTNEDMLYIAGIRGISNVYAGTEPEFLETLSEEFLFYPMEDTDYPLLIISEDSLDSLSTNAGIPSIYVDAADDADLDYIKEVLSEITLAKPWYMINDIAEWETQNRKLTTQLYIFFYGFLAVIIMIGSMNIINTINTSLIQRRREFAIFASVGMTKKQLSGMVLIETLIQGVKAGLLGSAAGVLLVYILYRLFGRIFDMTEFSIPWISIGITMGAAILISVISCIAPMKKLRNQDIISTIRSFE